MDCYSQLFLDVCCLSTKFNNISQIIKRFDLEFYYLSELNTKWGEGRSRKTEGKEKIKQETDIDKQRLPSVLLTLFNPVGPIMLEPSCTSELPGRWAKKCPVFSYLFSFYTFFFKWRISVTSRPKVCKSIWKVNKITSEIHININSSFGVSKFLLPM